MTVSLISSVGADSGGLKEGDSLGAFEVTKVAGALDDAVEPGETLCYRCRYGSRPMVLVFARETGGRVPELLEAIDKTVGANEDSRLKGLLTLMGKNASDLKEDASKIAEATNVKFVPIAVAEEAKTGPMNYKLSDDAEVTIILAIDSQVVATHTSDAAKIDVKSIIREVTEMLN